jgi:hypothetical protein
MACPPEPVEVFYYMAAYKIIIETSLEQQIEFYINAEKEIFIGEVNSQTNWFTISIEDWQELSSFINLEINKIK